MRYVFSHVGNALCVSTDVGRRQSLPPNDLFVPSHYLPIASNASLVLFRALARVSVPSTGVAHASLIFALAVTVANCVVVAGAVILVKLAEVSFVTGN